MRRRTLLALLPLAACSDPLPPRDFPPLRYDFLTPLRLNVGTVTVGDAPAPNQLDGQNPAPPGPALRQMMQDRLAAGGITGTATASITEAFISQFRGGLDGALAVQLFVIGGDGARLGGTEARVTRRLTGIARGGLQGALYDMTRLMLGDMNVEFEYQVRRALRPYLQEVSTAPAPEPVEAAPL